jgi:hypothetical protein
LLVDKAVISHGIKVVYAYIKVWNAVVALFGACELMRNDSKAFPPVLFFIPWGYLIRQVLVTYRPTARNGIIKAVWGYTDHGSLLIWYEQNSMGRGRHGNSL